MCPLERHVTIQTSLTLMEPEPSLCDMMWGRNLQGDERIQVLTHEGQTIKTNAPGIPGIGRAGSKLFRSC